MIDFRDLLVECHDRGVRLQQDGRGGLTIDGPQKSLTPDLIARLKAQKSNLLAMLELCSAPTGMQDAAVVWRATMILLGGDPSFPPNAMEALRNARAVWSTETPATSGQWQSPNPKSTGTPASAATGSGATTVTGGIASTKGDNSAANDIAHKAPGCRSRRSWRHVWGDCYCLDCWPPTDPLAVVTSPD
jgi:hypothetical protein